MYIIPVSINPLYGLEYFPMKKLSPVYLFTCLLVSLSLLTACVRELPIETPPPRASATSLLVASPITLLTQVAQGTRTPTVNPTQARPTNTASPSNTSPASTSEATQETGPTETFEPPPSLPPSVTPIVFDPAKAFGPPQLVFDGTTGWETYASPFPDNTNIRLGVADKNMLVTGKNQLFDTWWFSWPTLANSYIEILVNTAQCAGEDAYGIAFHGQPSGDPSRGYLVSFSCDGRYRYRPIESSQVGWTPSPYIHTGADQFNTLGIWIEDGDFTLYANGVELATFSDDTYSSGRFGVLVHAGGQSYSYQVVQIRIWEVD